ncbi:MULTISPECIES: ComEA family DNA-binding protein [Terrabacteria group]|uniref:ComEA family DNA-binding protein n=1 Tax=Bacillati TaxID=1783272 RepID=UPI001C6EB97B|nr:MULTISPECIES: ComEA family DNA-binding protein [Terrabacteria group]MBW9211843.1 ComEA family DNA-binding protein [Trueperella sp. zg.1013]
MRRLLIVFLCFLSSCRPKSYLDVQEIDQTNIRITIMTEKQERKELVIQANSTIEDIVKLVPIDFQKHHYNPKQVLHEGDVLFLDAKESTKVSLNTASLNDFMKIKGIGKKMAQRILDYRKENGLFQKLDDLQKVKGIGKKKYEELQSQITL